MNLQKIRFDSVKSIVKDEPKKFAYFNGYMFKPLSKPGVQDRAAANAVSKHRPKFNILLLKIYF